MVQTGSRPRPPRKGMLLNQPWARLVAEGVFPVLVRQTPTHTRGQVAVVAWGVDVRALVDGKRPDPTDFPRSAVVGYVTIVACVKVPKSRIVQELRRHFGNELADFYPRHYFPANSPAYFWVLAKAKALRRSRFVPAPRNRVWVHLPQGPEHRREEV